MRKGKYGGSETCPAFTKGGWRRLRAKNHEFQYQSILLIFSQYPLPFDPSPEEDHPEHFLRARG
jgi:hypothetical protein